MIEENKQQKVDKLSHVILGPAAKQIGEWLGDYARLWRLNNLASISDKFYAICRKRGIDLESGRTVALSTGLPLLNTASYQDDGFLQDRWANLLASVVQEDAGEDYNIDLSFVRALEQFSRLDCQVLEYVVEHGIVPDPTDRAMTLNPVTDSDVRQTFPHSDIVHLCLEKLVQLGCIARIVRLPLTPKREEHQSDGLNSVVEDLVPTSMGANLYISSSGKTPSWYTPE